MSWFTERRMDFIDWCLDHHGELQRGNLMKTFDISTPQASADIQAFMKLYPGAIRYDLTMKRYVPAQKNYRSRRAAPKAFSWKWPLQ